MRSFKKERLPWWLSVHEGSLPSMKGALAVGVYCCAYGSITCVRGTSGSALEHLLQQLPIESCFVFFLDCSLVLINKIESIKESA